MAFPLMLQFLSLIGIGASHHVYTSTRGNIALAHIVQAIPIPIPDIYPLSFAGNSQMSGTCQRDIQGVMVSRSQVKKYAELRIYNCSS
ncbi:MAG: hypothetical protein AAGI69_09130 [Cyanobacteria bacterium P01_H01_bin.21]